MALPIIAAAVMAGSAIMQWFNSEQARNASAEELKYMENLWNKLQEPNFDWNQIEPEEYQVVEQYVPETAMVIQEAAPQVVERSKDYDIGRDAQLQALYHYLDVAKSGDDPRFEAKMQQSYDRSNTEANSAMRGIEQRMNERGTFGSGIQAVMQATASQGAADRAARLSQEAAAQSYENQMLAADKAAGLGRNIEGSEFQRASKNTDIINDFNERMASRRQNIHNMNVGIRNDATQRFWQNRQRVGDANVEARNRAAYANKDAYNELAQRQFDNRQDIVSGKTGQARERRADTIQNAQDRNQAIQGLSNAGTNWAIYEQGRQDSGRAEERADAREYFKKYGEWPDEAEQKKMRTSSY